MNNHTEKLIRDYRSRRAEIKKRLRDFSRVWREPDERIFSELLFCICTPQSNAVYCDRAVKQLEEKGCLLEGGHSSVRKCLKAVRFPNNKSRYIIEARKTFLKGGRIAIKEKIDTSDIAGTRIWLVKNVKGLGLKEASHFLRNIGQGKDLAILDVHIMRNMKAYGMIEDIPAALSKKRYFDLEDKLRCFSKRTKIPMDELDLLFWSSGTGRIFK